MRRGGVCFTQESSFNTILTFLRGQFIENVRQSLKKQMSANQMASDAELGCWRGMPPNLANYIIFTMQPQINDNLIDEQIMPLIKQFIFKALQPFSSFNNSKQESNSTNNSRTNQSTNQSQFWQDALPWYPPSSFSSSQTQNAKQQNNSTNSNNTNNTTYKYPNQENKNQLLLNWQNPIPYSNIPNPFTNIPKPNPYSNVQNQNQNPFQNAQNQNSNPFNEDVLRDIKRKEEEVNQAPRARGPGMQDCEVMCRERITDRKAYLEWQRKNRDWINVSAKATPDQLSTLSSINTCNSARIYCPQKTGGKSKIPNHSKFKIPNHSKKSKSKFVNLGPSDFFLFF